MTQKKKQKDRLEGKSGIVRELHGLKNMINELQTAFSQLDYEMRRDMKLLQTQMIGLQSKLDVNGLHEAYKLHKKKVHHGTKE